MEKLRENARRPAVRCELAVGDVWLVTRPEGSICAALAGWLPASRPSRRTVLVPSYRTMVRPVGPSALTGLQQMHLAWLSSWNASVTGLSLETLGPVGQSVPSTMMAT
jgi:hypothetical protein